MDLLVCSTCNMSFRSSHFLSKHQEKFCIGYADQRQESDYPQILCERIRELQRKHQQRRSHDGAQSYQQIVHLKTEHQLPKPNSEPTANRADQQIQDLSEIHKRCVLQSSDSEKTNKQRRETNQQEPNAQNSKVPQLEKMILNLKAQEQKNTMLLESLMDHLQHSATEPMPVTFKGGDVLQSSNADLLIPETRENLTHTDIPVYRNGGLSSEISTVRVSYLQNGGKDPQILAQLEDLLNEAITVEMLAGWPKNLYSETIKHGPKPKDNKKDLFRELISTELENQHLEEKIMKLHLRRRKSAFTRTSPEQLQFAFSRTTPNCRRREQEMRSMKMDIDLLKHEVEINHLRKMTKSRKLGPTLGIFPPLEEPRSQTPPRSKYSMEVSECFGPAPYDLMVQPVPSISLVMEVQASGGYDIYRQEVTHLAPRGWVKLDIFDHHNRIVSGRWKIPVRIPPVKPSMTTAEVNTVPQLDNAELYLRIVNARDADIQSAAPISIYTAGICRYAPVTARDSFTK